MTPTTQRRVSALSLSLALGLAFMPQGCGSGTPAAEVPGAVAWQLKTCAAKHSHHLGAGSYSVSFDVVFSNDGHVESLSLRDSTLRDEDLERCMASVLHSLAENDLLAFRAEERPRDRVAPASTCAAGAAAGRRALLGLGALLARAGLFDGRVLHHRASLRSDGEQAPPAPHHAADPKAHDARHGSQACG